MISKFKHFVKENKKDILLFTGVFLVAMLSFSLGYIMAKMEEKEPLQFEEPIYHKDQEKVSDP